MTLKGVFGALGRATPPKRRHGARWSDSGSPEEHEAMSKRLRTLTVDARLEGRAAAVRALPLDVPHDPDTTTASN
jgi:hypothetical protein